MNYRSCVIVLISEETSNRPWVRYEIERAWKEGKGIVEIHIHGLKDSSGKQVSTESSTFWQCILARSKDYDMNSQSYIVYEQQRII